MKIVLLALVMLLGCPFISNALSLEVVRKNYQLAVTDRNVCKSMLEQLRDNQESNIHRAYLGAFQMIWAKHIFNLIDKLRAFNKGKTNIDKVAKLVQNNVEIIFIRYSVQRNSPGFLGYNDNLKEDKNFLYKNRNSISSVTLKTMVEKLLNS